MTDGNERRDAIAALLNNADQDFSCAVASINQLVDPGDDGVRIRQIISFLAHIMLQMPNDRFRDAMYGDAQEGMGTILSLCAEALETQEDFKEALQMIESNNVTKLEVDS